MKIIVARSASDIHKALEFLSAAEVIGCDTETSGLDPKTNRLLSVQFSDGERGVLVPVSENAPLGDLEKILLDPAKVKIFHNARFDLSFLAEFGCRVENVFDTMIAEKVLTRGANQSVSLAETLYRYFAVDLDKSQRRRFGRNWSGNWSEDLVEYAMNDVLYLPRLMSEQRRWMEKLALSGEFEDRLARMLELTAGRSAN